jgi:hypothetical protein
MEEDYTLQAIFASDPSIAYDWLARRVGNSAAPTNAWKEDEPFATATGLLSVAQRRNLIGGLTRDTWPREIVSLLVGGDPTLYQMLLDRPDLAVHHLEPLQGDPDAAWIALARVAVAAGFTPGEVARAARGVMWSWEGNESDMWSRWVALFQPLASDYSDTLAQKIGEAGLNEAQEYLQRARAEERKEAVHGC